MHMRKAEMMSEQMKAGRPRGVRAPLRGSLVAACGALFVAALLPVGAAQAQQNTVSIGVVNSFIPGAAYDPLSSDDYQGRMGLQYARALLPLAHGSLWVDGAYTLGSSRSDLFGGELETHAFFQTVTAGVGYRLPLWSWLVPRARAGLGVLVGNLELSAGDEVLSDWSAAFTGYALAGVELLWPKPLFRSRGQVIRGGLVIEGGYSFSTALGFELEPEVPEDQEDQLRLPVVASQVGDLALNGGQLWVSLVVHF